MAARMGSMTRGLRIVLVIQIRLRVIQGSRTSIPSKRSMKVGKT